jgi:hypothetical protein
MFSRFIKLLISLISFFIVILLHSPPSLGSGVLKAKGNVPLYYALQYRHRRFR